MYGLHSPSSISASISSSDLEAAGEGGFGGLALELDRGDCFFPTAALRWGSCFLRRLSFHARRGVEGEIEVEVCLRHTEILGRGGGRRGGSRGLCKWLLQDVPVEKRGIVNIGDRQILDIRLRENLRKSAGYAAFSATLRNVLRNILSRGYQQLHSART